MRTKCVGIRLWSVYKFLCKAPILWIIGKNPRFHGLFAALSVDNRVENVDFCISTALYIQFHVYIRASKVLQPVAAVT